MSLNRELTGQKTNFFTSLAAVFGLLKQGPCQSLSSAASAAMRLRPTRNFASCYTAQTESLDADPHCK